VSAIDLRGDTVTRPSDAMRRAMAEAPVGDDVYGEDPTVNRLQAVLAERLGKEAALFMASGTMSNQVAVKTLTQPGDEVICHRWSHVYNFEGGTAPAMSGVGFYPIEGEHGVITAEQVEVARQQVIKKRGGSPELEQVRFEPFREGKALQIMHIGAFADEPRTLAVMDAYAAEHGYTYRGKHHEIYLSDFRKTAPERLRTILRHPIED